MKEFFGKEELQKIRRVKLSIENKKYKEAKIYIDKIKINVKKSYYTAITSSALNLYSNERVLAIGDLVNFCAQNTLFEYTRWQLPVPYRISWLSWAYGLAPDLPSSHLTSQQTQEINAWQKVNNQVPSGDMLNILTKIYLLNDGINVFKNQNDLIDSMKCDLLRFKFTPTFWQHLYKVLYGKLWLKAAYMARDNAVKATIALQQCGYELTDIESAVLLAETGDYLQAAKQLQHSNDTEALEIAAACLLLAGVKPDNIAFHITQSDRSYAELIRDKRIAVVAPSAAETFRGEEIDSYDIVIRTNIVEPELLKNVAKHTGRRTDIVYFNGRFEDAVDLKALSESSTNIKYFCHRFKLKEESKNSRIGYIANPYFGMNTYAIPKILHDIIRFKPKEVSIFNTDFFLNKTPHYHGYIDYDVDLMKSFRAHDALRNFKMMKGYWSAGLYTAKPPLDKILSMSEEQFIDTIEQRLTERLYAGNFI